MQPSQLHCRDLQPGDILLKVSDGSFIHHAIQLGQALTGGRNPGIIHAGLMFDPVSMIEAQATGVAANDLRVQNKGYGYYVYRCTRLDMARGAASCAKMMLDMNLASGSFRYNLGGALVSIFGSRGRAASRGGMDALFDRVLAGRGRPFFCSQLVVFIYQLVAEHCGVPASAVFPLSDAKAPTSTLSTALVGNPFFRERGWLLPNER